MVGPPRRILCVHIACFLVEVARQGNARLRGVPVAVLPGKEGPSRRRLEEVSSEAAQQGVRSGMTPTQAQAVCPELCLVSRSPTDADVIQGFMELLQTFSPKVENHGGGVFFLDSRGLQRLLGDEEALLQKLAARLQEAQWPASVGMAGTRFAAFAAALCGRQGERVQNGEERRFLAPLPLEVLPLSAELQERLAGLGIQTLGEFAALPGASVEVRFGREGVHFHRLACGEDQSLLCFALPEEEEEVEVQVHAFTVGQLQLPLQQALAELLQRRGERRYSCASLRFGFELEDGAYRDLEVTTAQPTTRAEVFWELLRLGLSGAASPFSAAVVAVRIRVTREHVGIGEQGTLFGDPAGMDTPDRGPRLGAAVRWLQARYGAGAVVQATLQDSHRPEKKHLLFERPAALPWSGATVAGRNNDALVPALRLVDPPQLLEVRIEDRRLESFSGKYGRYQVQTMVGPRRLSGEWWQNPFERDYFEVLTSDGGLFWIFYSRPEGQWFLQGVFD